MHFALNNDLAPQRSLKTDCFSQSKINEKKVMILYFKDTTTPGLPDYQSSGVLIPGKSNGPVVSIRITILQTNPDEQVIIRLLCLMECKPTGEPVNSSWKPFSF